MNTRSDFLEMVWTRYYESTINGKKPSKEMADIVVNKIKEVVSTCYICSGPSTMVGVFRPNDAKEFGCSEGMDRDFYYGVCSECEIDPDAINAAILRQVKAGNIESIGK